MGALPVWSWLGPSGIWDAAKLSCIPLPWELLYLHRAKAVAFGAGMRAEAGLFYEVEAMSKGGWHRDSPKDIRVGWEGVVFSS